MAINPTRFLKNFKTFQKQTRNLCSNNNKDSKTDNKKTESVKEKERVFPKAPTTCCMSGCANCVWVEYAEKLSEYFQDGGAKAVEEINERITDPNMKAFLMHELRMRKLT